MPDALPWDQFENHHAVTKKSQAPVYILGAGLAGCWMARTLAEAGIQVVVLEAGAHVASAASSNPAGIVKPFISRSPGLATSFYREAYRCLLERLDQWELGKECQYSACGVVQLSDTPYPASPHYETLLSEQMKDVLGVLCDSQGVLFEQAGWLNPCALCFALLQHSLIELQTQYRVQSIEQLDDDEWCWQLQAEGQTPLLAAHLVIANGTSLPDFVQSCKLSITPARGQISRFELKPDAAALKRVVSGNHYIIPDGNTVIAGATFERDNIDDEVRAEDNLKNLGGLHETLSALDVTPEALDAFAGIRATTPDRFPLVGPLPDADRLADVYADLHHGRDLHTYPSLPVFRGAFVLGGLGSRGIVTAPYSASLLADYMMGGDAITHWSAIINPARFAIRALKRQKPQGL